MPDRTGMIWRHYQNWLCPPEGRRKYHNHVRLTLSLIGVNLQAAFTVGIELLEVGFRRGYNPRSRSA